MAPHSQEKQSNIHPPDLELHRVFDAEMLPGDLPEQEEYTRVEKGGGDTLPFSVITSDLAGQHEFTAVLTPEQRSSPDGDTYALMTRSVAQSEGLKPHLAAELLKESFDTIQSDNNDFAQPPAVIVYKSGKVAWSAGRDEKAFGLIHRLKDGALKWLGGAEGEKTCGVLRPLDEQEALYLAPNELLTHLHATDMLNEASLQVAFRDSEGVPVVELRFNDDLRHEPAEQQTPAAAAAHARQVAREQRSATAAGEPDVQSTSSSQPAAPASANTSAAPKLQAPWGARPITPEVQSSAVATPEVDTPDIEQEREHLATLREEMATVAGKRQGRLFSFGDKKYKTLEDDYNAQLAKLGRLECADLLADDNKTDAEKNIDVVEFIFAEQATLRRATIENLKGTPISKMIDWVARGSRKQRFIKGAALGAGAVIVGASIGALAGVAAGAGLAAAAAVAAKSAVRFGRSFAMRDNKEGRGMAMLEDKEKDRAIDAFELAPPVDRFAATTKYFSGIFNRDTATEQAKRRKSAKSAMGGVALGLAIGGAGAWAVGELAGGGHLGDWSNRNLPDNHANALDYPDGDALPDNNVTPPYDDYHYSGPEVGAPAEVEAPTVIEYSDTAMTVSAGEGWYQTFAELGITNSQDQINLLSNDELMNKLAAKGLAYRAPELGGWGMNMTPDGRMPRAALDLVAEYVVKNGYDLAA